MKNAVQIVTLREVENKDIKELLENHYEEQLMGCDNYFRYYPNNKGYGSVKGSEKINKWLKEEGYKVNKSEFFHLLIRWDW